MRYAGKARETNKMSEPERGLGKSCCEYPTHRYTYVPAALREATAMAASQEKLRALGLIQ